MNRYDLTDFQWSVIEPSLPNKPRGVPRVDDQRLLNGIVWVLRSGPPGDTPQPPAWRLGVAGSRLPATEGRQHKKIQRGIGGLTEVHIRRGDRIVAWVVPGAD